MFIVQCDKLTVDIPLHKYAHRKKTRPPFKRASLDDIMSQSELTIQYLNRYFTWIMAGVHRDIYLVIYLYCWTEEMLLGPYDDLDPNVSEEP